MENNRASGAAAPTPAQIAKGALRRLAMSKLEPTPENYARAYADEAGEAATLMPERARPLLERLVSRLGDEPARRDEMVSALMQGRWEAVKQGLDRAGASAATQAQAWASLIERLARGLERGGRQWTMARRKESLQRVLDGSRSDMQRLQQRLQPLIHAWETDSPLPADPDLAELAEPVLPGADPSVLPPPLAQSSTGADADAWAQAVGSLQSTVAAGLPATEARAVELADALAALADRLAVQGPSAAWAAEVDSVCEAVRRLFAHRHHLSEQLGRLCNELSQGLTELSEDDSWARGQCEALQARLADGISARGVRAATELLAETRQRQQRVREERNAARDALKQLIHRLLHELGDLGEHTGRFEESVGRHAEAIERADSLESLAGVVSELLDESRAVQAVVAEARRRVHDDHLRAEELETRVRALEAELRRLSEEVSTDALTQVANRRGLQQAFAVECARLTRDGPGAMLAVALLDIDNFKKLNDTLGHAAGDQALVALAAAVRERLRPGDHLARFGGEEFVVLLPQTPADEAQQVLSRLQRGLTASLFMHDQKEVFVTFSAGVTAWRTGEALELALERADEALYEAKRTGKNRTCLA